MDGEVTTMGWQSFRGAGGGGAVTVRPARQRHQEDQGKLHPSAREPGAAEILARATPPPGPAMRAAR
jgi:hypothetical protein